MDESNEGAAAVRSKYITDQTKLAWMQCNVGMFRSEEKEEEMDEEKEHVEMDEE